MKDLSILHVVDGSVIAIKIQFCNKVRMWFRLITLQNPYYCQLLLLSKENHTTYTRFFF